MKKIFLASVCVVLGGCQTIGNWADDVGQHLPVLADERCDSWQCFTEDGQEKSKFNQMRMKQRWEQEKLEDEAEAKGEKLPQQAPPPPAYNPPPEMDPWNNYQP